MGKKNHSKQNSHFLAKLWEGKTKKKNKGTLNQYTNPGFWFSEKG